MLAAQGTRCAGYYESTDGLHWTKPVVGQVEYRGSRQNNYITTLTGKGYRAPTHVVYDDTDPNPARRYKAAMTNEGFLASPDGIAWTLLDVPPVPSQDESNLSFDRQTHLFLHTVKHRGPYGRSVWLSTSPDFAHWTEPQLTFHADDRDQEIGRERIAARLADPTLQRLFAHDPALYNVEVYNMGLFRYEGQYIGIADHVPLRRTTRTRLSQHRGFSPGPSGLEPRLADLEPDGRPPALHRTVARRRRRL